MQKRFLRLAIIALATPSLYWYSHRPTVQAIGRYTIVDLEDVQKAFDVDLTRNARGQVTGSYRIGRRDVVHAFRTSGTGTARDDLGTLGGTCSVGRAINDSGQVTGASGVKGRGQHAFRTSPTGKISDNGTDLGTLGGVNSDGQAINSRGQVTGGSYLRGTWGQHAFRTSPTGKISDNGTDLGTLGGVNSVGRAINALGDVVGYSDNDDDSTTHAFLYTDESGMQDLNNLLSESDQKNWILHYGCGISDSGQITGMGLLNGHLHAFRLIPISTPAKP